MAKFTVLPSDMKLYSPAEPAGRVFLAGEAWPGDAWSDQPGGDEVGRGTVMQSLKDLEAAKKQSDDLRKMVESGAHDLAQMGKERDEALAKVAGLVAAVQAAEQSGGQGAEILKGLTEERDAARADAATQKARADKLDGDLTDTKATIERLTGELSEAKQAGADKEGRVQELETDLANASAKLAAFDGDGDGAPGGSRAKAKA
jgi:chromosome segregation ATPase